MQEAESTFGITIAPISKGMDVRFGQALFFHDVNQSFEVIDVGVNTSVRNQPHDVEWLTIVFGIFYGIEQHWIVVQFVLSYGFIDAGQFLVHYASGTNIEVAYFRVAHLPIGQSHLLAVCNQGGVGVLRVQTIYKRCVGLGNRVG